MPSYALATLHGSGMPPPGGGNQEGGEPPTIDFAGMFQELKRRWWVIALCVLLCSGAAIAYVLKAQRIYAAEAMVEVEQEPTRILNGSQMGPTDLKALEMLKTIETKIASQGMFLRVIKALNLDQDPTFVPAREFKFNDDELVQLLQKKVAVALDRGTRLIAIKVEDTDPVRAKKIADQFLLECTVGGNKADTDAARALHSTLERGKDKALEDLKAAESEVNKYRTAHPSVTLDENPSESKTTSSEDRVKTVGNQLNEARAEVLRLQNSADQLKGSKKMSAEELLRLPGIATSDEVMSLQKALNEKKAAFASIDAIFLPKYPAHIRATKELQEVQMNLLSAAQKAASVIENRLAQARENETKLMQELTTAKNESVENKKIIADFDVLARDLKVQREHYNEVLTRLKQVELSQDFGGNAVKIADAPILPTWPVKPKKKLVVGGAGGFGFLMGVGIVLLLRFMDPSIRNLVQGEKAFSLPGLAAVPDAPAKHPIDRLITSPSTTPETSEAFRAMRTSLTLLGKGITARSFLFTSPSSGDGKSYCASNYAIALAHQGYRTLLIDADLRKPTLDLLLLGKRSAAGLVTHLQGNEKPEDAKACSPTSIANLYLFSAGESGSAHPAELLSGQAFHDLIEDALKWFHRVVIDTPPVNAVTDALLLAREVDTVALVIRSGKTSRSATKHAISKLAMAGARPVGFILNGASAEALASGYTGDFSHAMIAPLTRPILSLPPPAQS